MLTRMAQQGKQASKRMRIPLWRITPTRFKFPLPYVCRKTGRKNAEVDPHSSKQHPESASKLVQNVIASLFLQGSLRESHSRLFLQPSSSEIPPSRCSGLIRGQRKDELIL